MLELPKWADARIVRHSSRAYRADRDFLSVLRLVIPHLFYFPPPSLARPTRLVLPLALGSPPYPNTSPPIFPSVPCPGPARLPCPGSFQSATAQQPLFHPAGCNGLSPLTVLPSAHTGGTGRAEGRGTERPKRKSSSAPALRA
ncbi:unnamed protein product [Calypogeia fissa]